MSESPSGRPLEGKIAIVTGGASGIGRATVRSLAALGCGIAVVDRDVERAEEAAREVSATAGSPPARGLGLDVTSEADMERMAAVTLERFGRIDILVASAGILRARGAAPRPVAQTSPAEFDEVVGVNLRGTFLSNRAVLGAMIRQGGGQIVNVSSTSGQRGRALDAAYCASKFGIIGFSESLAEEVRHSRIRVQVILPDAVATPLWNQNGPFGAPPEALPPERIGELIAYLVTLPADTVLDRLTVTPFRGRRRKAAAAGRTEGASRPVGEPT